MHVAGTGIFWTTIAIVTITLFLVTLIGRLWSGFFPRPFQPQARFYLAPVLGLSTLIIVASLAGRFLPFGGSMIVPLLTLFFLVLAIVMEKKRRRAFEHALTVSLFGMVCGVSVLAPLFVYGAMNAHNDTFTYLVHGNWLQEHAFSEVITPEAMTPQNSQIGVYQHGNFRMGGSYLLGFMQGLFHIRWSYEVYPSIVITALASCLFALGFLLFRLLAPFSRSNRLMLLALPAFSFGGLVFGANMGFMPQTVGLASGSALVFAIGHLFQWTTATKSSRSVVARAAIPLSLLFTASVMAYSEFAPFLLASMLGSAALLALRYRVWSNLLLLVVILLGLSALLLNTEIVRSYMALKEQSNAIVGSPVEWSLPGFFAHALGVHGGAWEAFQWANPEKEGSRSFFAGWFLLVLVTLIVLGGSRALRHSASRPPLMPAAIVLLLSLCGLLYFRYLVPSPFPTGVGQSWSQFKLSEWVNPFMMALLLCCMAALRVGREKLFDRSLRVLFMMTLTIATITSLERIRPLMSYYKGVHDLNRFYIDFRNMVLAASPKHERIYLDLGGNDLKFRQMAALYLFDREVASDWHDDGYIYQMLSPQSGIQKLRQGDLLVEPIGPNCWLSEGKEIGPFRTGMFNGHPGRIRIASITGAYDCENDGKNRWYWVEKKIDFTLESSPLSKQNIRTKLSFGYQTRGNQTLTVQIINHNRSSRKYLLKSAGMGIERFDQLLDLSPDEIENISIETDGKATPLGNGDNRVAAWVIRDVQITPAFDNQNSL